MAELIDRYEIYAAIGFERCNKNCMNCPTKCTWYYTIKNIPSVDRFIPCSERLPVLYVPVMILTEDGSYAIAHVTENEDEYLWFGDGGHYSKDYVLFWMPLPKKPDLFEKEVRKYETL